MNCSAVDGGNHDEPPVLRAGSNGYGERYIFTRVLSDCCRPLHMACDWYYFLGIKAGADRRVMGIATADETAP